MLIQNLKCIDFVSVTIPTSKRGDKIDHLLVLSDQSSPPFRQCFDYQMTPDDMNAGLQVSAVGKMVELTARDCRPQFSGRLVFSGSLAVKK